MFEDFHASDSTQQSRRIGRSFGLAVLIYCSAGAAIVSATNKARELVKDTLTQIEFAPPPEQKPEPPPEPPPEPVAEKPKPKPAPRAGTKRADIKPPDKMPTEKPAESSAPLPQVAATAPIDGVIGVSGGTGTGSKAVAVAPEPPPKMIPAKELPGNRAPPYPPGAKRDGIEGDVLVSFDVLPDGHVANPQIVKGPSEFHEVVLKTVVTWRFQPATLGGKPVKERRTKLITFRGEE